MNTHSDILFTAAGSGGHIQTALAVIEELRETNSELADRILFVGSNLTMEGELIKTPLEEVLCTRMNVKFVKIRGGKLQRSFSIHSFKLFIGILYSFLDSFRLIKRIKPKLIVSFGGYVSLPLALMSKIFGAKIITHEQTTSIGLSNNIIARIADVICFSYKESERFIPKGKKKVYTGSPSRAHLLKNTTYPALLKYIEHENSPLLNEKDYLKNLKNLEQTTLPVIFIMGGSQGSHVLNITVQELLPTLLIDFIVILQTGDNQVYKDFDAIQKTVQTLPDEIRENLVLRKFIYEEMGYIYANTDLFIGRSGANTVYEIGMLRIPSIFIPIPWVTHNEQYTNAKVVEDLGLSKIIVQRELTSSKLLDTIKEVYSTAKDRRANSIPHDLFPADASARVAKVLSELVSSL